MSSTFTMSCPNCDKPITLPTEARGKKIRCKSCTQVFTVPSTETAKPAKAKPLPADLQKPPAKAKAKAKPTAPPAEAPPPAADAPIGFAKDEDEVEDNDDDPRSKLMNVVIEEEVPRCPHCATELDPPDTKVCMNCGYDMLVRKRHGSKKVYEHTTEDYFMWWLPAIGWLVAMFFVLLIELWFIFRMRLFVEDTLDFLVKDEKNEVTKQNQFYLHPDAFTTCFSVFTLAVFAFGIKYCYGRLVVNWKPPEVEKKTS